MKYKNAIVRSVVIICILILSCLCGLLFQIIWNAIDRVNYPQEYSDFVEVYSYEYGVPESVVYSVIKVESDFESGAVSEAGAVGLMQLMPETFVWLTTENGENLNSATLYDPETNIKYGTYYLSQLWLRFGNWDAVFAAYNAGPTKVDEWLDSEEYSENGKTLDDIPYDETEKYVGKVNKANEIYKKLYYEG